MKNFFVKSHGLGNDYIVLNSDEINFPLTEKNIRLICDVHFGIGSDGILLKIPSAKADFGLRIFNPDGSEAEKSGNGLRIFSKYLYDYLYTNKSKVFTIETAGGIVTSEVLEQKARKASLIKVDMGKAIFQSSLIPVAAETEECFDYPLEVDGKTFRINCVSVGNPHCVIITDRLDMDELMQYGPLLEKHPFFPNRINVQFAKVLSPSEVEILIWERGAGYTLASGSSSCAVAAAVIKKGLTSRDLIIKMQGGNLKVSINEDWDVRMSGEVKEISYGYISDELLNELEVK
ncbi:MAG: diaminopimelate epimerase [Bacteroidetes bacterium GWF2_42_66]|nr:MAG: diaminopimelate epimerase [Bacteroidetes bacterium GWA2_42_15]OFY02922.1 MAG: diaminopimelate epimerase [Bacteroidetes bacterium GWE2_42_39]OFY44577.1 MAG: diaminopimelate epimerase [Bacteroidetes bacterium GWF2_42_66]HBL74968.1 diaminopimelate epimerase [Prolixibacteraceae bacterium]HCR89271.1 diaminopimelate epimerase [Prolixibacteraceae bacterium]